MIQKDHSTKEKIFRGSYTYSSNGEDYTEEKFEVFREIKEQTFSFESELMSRALTGEMLRNEVVYTITKDFVPIEVIIERTLGDKLARETFKYSSLKNLVSYTFFGGGGEIDYDISVPPKFHIMCPAACTSSLYLRSKKVDPNSKNVFSVVNSTNMWHYEDDPFLKALVLEKQGSGTTGIKIGGQDVQATHYKVWDYDESGMNNSNPDDLINLYVSKHLSIPYLLDSTVGTQIKINYLNNLDQAT